MTRWSAFLRRVPEDVVVAFDEAYREFVTDPSVPDGTTLLDEHPNLIVLRTFSKAYGLAGLRVGYAIASDPDLIAALRQTQVPFSVTTVAQEAALASLEPPAEQQLRDRVAEVVVERDRVRSALLDAGYDVPPTQANFVWLPLGDSTVDWSAGCEQRKVIVRGFAGHGARVTIGTPEENDRFLDAARELATAVAYDRRSPAQPRPQQPSGHEKREGQQRERQHGAGDGRDRAEESGERVPAAVQPAEEPAAVVLGLGAGGGVGALVRVSVIAAVAVCAASARCCASSDSRSLSRCASSDSTVITSEILVARWYRSRSRAISRRALVTREVTSATLAVTSCVDRWRDFSTPSRENWLSADVSWSGGTRRTSVAVA